MVERFGPNDLAPVAALFVREDGPYPQLARECYPLRRDARRYDGPWPVVAHPPCARWGRYWSRGGGVLGGDGGAFASALASVRLWGGVLEHPEGSRAWDAFGLPPPRPGEWNGSRIDGWSTVVDQGRYGHRARKRTWLYAAPRLPIDGLSGPQPPLPPLLMPDDRRAYLAVERMGHREREVTPLAFAVVLVGLAIGSRDVVRRVHAAIRDASREAAAPVLRG